MVRMAILASSTIVSKSLWILLVTLMCLHPKQVAGFFDDGSYSSDENDDGGSKSEESLNSDFVFSPSSASLADFPRNLRNTRTHHREEIPSGINAPIGPEYLSLPLSFPRLRHRSTQQTLKDSSNSMSKDETDFPRADESVQEKPTLTLPSRFSYVARQFYQYVWERRNNPKKDDRETAKDGKSPGKHQEPEEKLWGTDDDGNKNEGEVQVYAFTTESPSDVSNGPKISWRNIIGVQPNGCPPGHQKDMNGRCRLALW